MMTVLVHAHVFYPEMWGELKDCISHIKAHSSCFLYVTLTQPNPLLEADIRAFDHQVEIVYVENKGWDIAPFLTVINQVDLDKFDYVVKLHTKRNVPVFPCMVNGFDLSGGKWRQKLLNFCSSADKWLNSLHMLRKPNVGMVADEQVIVERDKMTAERQATLLSLLQQYGLSLGKNPKFVGGTMFAVRAEIVKLFQHKASADDFEETVRGREMTMAHYWERLFGYAVSAAGYDIVSFDGHQSSSLRFVKHKVKKFFFYKKITPEKRVVKVLGIPVYQRKIKI